MLKIADPSIEPCSPPIFILLYSGGVDSLKILPLQEKGQELVPDGKEETVNVDYPNQL